MNTCSPSAPPPEEIASPSVLVPPPPGPTSLVKSPNDPTQALTANRECDAVTALKRGLKEYLEQVSLNVLGQRVRFQAVHDVWAETDQVAKFPSAVVQSVGEATYDYASFAPVLDPARIVTFGAEPAQKRTYLVKYAEVVVQLALETHCSTPEERVSVAMMLEDALNPVDWMYGFKLVLPHYFNQVAVFEPATTQMLDTEADARRRWRPGTVLLAGQISVFRTRSLPALQPRVVVEVDSTAEGL